MSKKEKKTKEKIPFAQKHPKLNFILGLLILLGISIFLVLFVFLLIKMIGNRITSFLDWSKKSYQN